MAKFIDAHTHLQFLGYDSDRADVLRRAKDAGVRMITVGTQIATSETGIKLAEKYPEDIWATVGFHPSHFNDDWHHDKNEQKESEREKFDAGKLKELGRHKSVVAIGECGLDYFRLEEANKKEQTDRQKRGFIEQMKIARELDKPLMIHCRAAFDDLIQLLTTNYQLLTTPPGAVHFFTGTKDHAEKLLEMGFSFTFGGVITFSRDYDEAIKLIPLDRILSETDAPYVAPAPYRGKRNEPAYVVEVVKKLAEIKNVSIEEMADKILENANSIFALKI